MHDRKSARRDGDVFILVLCGATGDLAMRKIIPTHYAAFRNRLLVDSGRLVCFAPTSLDPDGYLRRGNEHVRSNVVDESATTLSFPQRVAYLGVDATTASGCGVLASFPESTPSQQIFYLATGPSAFVPTCQAPTDARLEKMARVVLGNPHGHDVDSSLIVNDAIGRKSAEHQTYRIDHSLGKELVQNHLLRMPAIVAVESREWIGPDSVRDEKLRGLRALKPISACEVARSAVRGECCKGDVRGHVAPAYRNEKHLGQDSVTETSVAVRAEIKRWRWARVPFFLRTSMRLAAQVAEIIVDLMPIQHLAARGGTFWPEEGNDQIVSSTAKRVFEKWTEELRRAEMQR